jgi:hypothetical protein
MTLAAMVQVMTPVVGESELDQIPRIPGFVANHG